MSHPPALEPIFDRTAHPFGGGPVDPIVRDASLAALCRGRPAQIFILRRHRLTVAVSNETDDPMDMAALNRLAAAAIECYA